MFPKTSNDEYPEATDGEDKQGHDLQPGSKTKEYQKQARTLPLRGSAGADGVLRTQPPGAKANRASARNTAVPSKARPSSSLPKAERMLLMPKQTISAKTAMLRPSVPQNRNPSYAPASPPPPVQLKDGRAPQASFDGRAPLHAVKDDLSYTYTATKTIPMPPPPPPR